MFALIRLLVTFYLVVPKLFLFRLYDPPETSPPPPLFISLPKPFMKLYKPMTLTWDLTVQVLAQSGLRFHNHKGLDLLK